MLILAVALAASLSTSTICGTVEQYRAQGYSDSEIEAIARGHQVYDENNDPTLHRAHKQLVPEYVIRWAKAHCKKN